MLTLADAITLSLDEGDVSVMSETVEQSGDTSSVREDAIPVFEGAIGGDEQRGTFVAAVDDFVEQISGAGVVREIADFVNAEQSRPAIMG